MTTVQCLGIMAVIFFARSMPSGTAFAFGLLSTFAQLVFAIAEKMP